MAYAVCMRARIENLEHWRDNSLTGRLVHSGGTMDFKTRGHIAKTVNSQYREVSWKPTEGEEIIFDGDIHGERVILDHIEPWRPQDFRVLDRHTELQERLVSGIAAMPEMTKSMRQRAHDDDGTEIRVIRWMKPAQASYGRQKMACIVSAIIADGEIRFAMRNRSGAALLPFDKVAVLPLLAGTLGIPSLTLDLQSTATPAPKVVTSGNPNKWRPGVDYRPEGMPEHDPFDFDAPSTGQVYDDIPF